MNADEFIALNYRTELVEKNGLVHFYVPDLRLIVSGREVSTAYQNLRDQKRRLFEQYMAAGRGQEIPLPAEVRQSADLKRTMTPFLLKAAVVALISVILIVAANVSITYTLADLPKTVALKAGRAALRSSISGLEEVAREGIAEGRDKRLRELLQAAVPHLKPYASILAPLFECRPGPAAPGRS
jgi:hypothetical protein